MTHRPVEPMPACSASLRARSSREVPFRVVEPPLPNRLTESVEGGPTPIEFPGMRSVNINNLDFIKRRDKFG